MVKIRLGKLIRPKRNSYLPIRLLWIQAINFFWSRHFLLSGTPSQVSCLLDRALASVPFSFFVSKGLPLPVSLTVDELPELELLSTFDSRLDDELLGAGGGGSTCFFFPITGAESEMFTEEIGLMTGEP